MSESAIERFVSLLGVGAMPAPPKDEREVDTVLAFAWAHWHVGPLLAERLVNWLPEQHRSRPAARALADRTIALRYLASVQVRLALALGRALGEAGIAYALLKGTAARFILYDRPTDRLGLDLDVVVRERDLDRAEDIALELGFERAQWCLDGEKFVTADPVIRAVTESRHYELGFLTRMQAATLDSEENAAIRRALPLHARWIDVDGVLATTVTVDVHHHPAFGIPVEAVLAQAQSFELVGGGVLKVGSLGSLTFLLIHKTYWEAIHGTSFALHHYADLCRAIPRLDDGQGRICASLLERHTGAAAAGWVLRRLPRHFGVEIPKSLSHLVAEAPGNGDHWPALMAATARRMARFLA